MSYEGAGQSRTDGLAVLSQLTFEPRPTRLTGVCVWRVPTHVLNCIGFLLYCLLPKILTLPTAQTVPMYALTSTVLKKIEKGWSII